MFDRFLHPHYILNSAVIIAFVIARFYSMIGSFNLVAGYQTEANIWIIVGVMTMMKALNSNSIEMLTASFFFYVKTGIFVVFFGVGAYKLLGVYIVVILVLLLAFPQPAYRRIAEIEYFDALRFSQLFMDKDDSDKKIRKDRKGYFVVEFYTTWANACTHFAPIFASVAQQFSSSHVRFGKIDVGRFPVVAQHFDIGTQASTTQLPTLILFHNGKEVNRIPSKTNTRRVYLTCNDVVDGFHLLDKQNY